MYRNSPKEIATQQKYINKLLKEYFIKDSSDKIALDLESTRLLHYFFLYE